MLQSIDDFDIDKVNVDISGVFIPRRLEGRMDSLVKEKLRELNIVKTYSDGSVDVDGDVDLSRLGLTKIPIKFNRVTGDFICSMNDLTTLKNCPIEVGRHFICRISNLNSLEGCPVKVGGNFYCYDKGMNLKFTKKQIGEICNVKGDVKFYFSL